MIICLLAGASLTGCERAEPLNTAPGVSWELAKQRERLISDLRIHIQLNIPDSLAEPLRGRETLRMQLARGDQPVVIDIDSPSEKVLGVRVGGEKVEYDVVNNHIVLPATAVVKGSNVVTIDFIAGDGALNRNRDFLYSLFVPDRAHLAFPCFDQPNLKARYELVLEVPEDWEALSNTPVVSRESVNRRLVYGFAETQPLSSYLFSFAAGKFDVMVGERAGREFRMYHRETDRDKVQRNAQNVFDLHQMAVEWLEDYTGIPYPFEKFDFALIPAFQYGGMEHPGAILYRAASLFLDESATQNEQLRRASLIAHETAHMWFGDLVTMEWFNDVWMKEVFANFMAAKIVNPSFPQIDHELRFLVAHYPAAYAVDRTAGSNPIRQPLANLSEAGTLYGAIIYQKAPIIMRQLEQLIGEEALRDGLREYLRRFRFANASWKDLIDILDSRTAEDLETWSEVWVEGAARPTVAASVSASDEGRVAELAVSQSDPEGLGRVWSQGLSLALGYADTAILLPVSLDAPSVEVRGAKGQPLPSYVLPNGGGIGYGYFRLDQVSLGYFRYNLMTIPTALSRGAAWLALWEAVLHERLAAEDFLEVAVGALESETDELLVQMILDYAQVCYWRFLSEAVRTRVAADWESRLWELTMFAESTSLKAAYFEAYRRMALTDESLDRLGAIWGRTLEIDGLPLSERDHRRLAMTLAIHEWEGWESVLDKQLERIENPDRRAEFVFVRPSLSADPAIRDSFFAALAEPRNREHEPWVLEGLRNLHHPLRAGASLKYIRPSLEMLEEIRVTGDIFFPKNWLDATLDGHSGESAANVVRGFLEDHPEYPPRLRGKILQSADLLFRSARILQAKS
ncbi:MAG: ERAP1-like C-terminal domain-containing protein [Gemmatimonadota bacterium]|nr:MAG: ERAP1-like C-terminal domain-containing protein [Gemmatimonadota bacterium]